MSEGKITRVIVDDIYPVISGSLDKNYTAYKKNIEKYIQERSKDLFDTVPVKRLPFGADDINSYFKAIRINKADITSMMKNTYYWDINLNPRAAKDEFTVCMMMCIRYFILKKKPQDAEISAIYLAFSGKFYPSIHSGKFKIPPEKYRYIMEYVLNNVLTNKYDLKREGSVFGAIRSICRTWLNTYEDKFQDPDDEDIKDLIQQLHGRIKSFLGNIASAYYEAYKNKNYMTYGSDSEDQDDYRIADNDSLLAERFSENAMTWITTKGVDYRICRMASDKNVKPDEIRSIIESIQSDSDNLILVKELIQLIIIDYFSQSKDKDVTTYAFVNYSIKAKPNSHNKYIVRQKEIVEQFLDENSPQYRKRKSRLATKSSYFKSIMAYYILIINMANKQ
jgi:hypothetical protein